MSYTPPAWDYESRPADNHVGFEDLLGTFIKKRPWWMPKFIAKRVFRSTLKRVVERRDIKFFGESYYGLNYPGEHPVVFRRVHTTISAGAYELNEN